MKPWCPTCCTWWRRIFHCCFWRRRGKACWCSRVTFHFRVCFVFCCSSSSSGFLLYFATQYLSFVYSRACANKHFIFPSSILWYFFLRAFHLEVQLLHKNKIACQFPKKMNVNIFKICYLFLIWNGKMWGERSILPTEALTHVLGSNWQYLNAESFEIVLLISPSDSVWELCHNLTFLANKVESAHGSKVMKRCT